MNNPSSGGPTIPTHTPHSGKSKSNQIKSNHEFAFQSLINQNNQVWMRGVMPWFSSLAKRHEPAIQIICIRTDNNYLFTFPHTIHHTRPHTSLHYHRYQSLTSKQTNITCIYITRTVAFTVFLRLLRTCMYLPQNRGERKERKKERKGARTLMYLYIHSFFNHGFFSLTLTHSSLTTSS